jgi:hypothetical protein
VIAAVSVVLPWSMCPIVPMFTCGLFLSNFAFAISVVSFSANHFFFKSFLRLLPQSLFNHEKSEMSIIQREI